PKGICTHCETNEFNDSSQKVREFSKHYYYSENRSFDGQKTRGKPLREISRGHRFRFVPLNPASGFNAKGKIFGSAGHLEDPGDEYPCKRLRWLIVTFAASSLEKCVHDSNLRTVIKSTTI
ncbi:hypothetical protein CEXT_558811, partial [Caerostris extrusa]